MFKQTQLQYVLSQVAEEANEAESKHGHFNSAHEGYAVLLEEVEELWDEVKKKPKNRDHDNMYKEAIQVAASALRFALDIVED